MAQAYVGEVRFFPFPTVPKGWATCDGATLQISQNQALFAIIGTTYGGDGRITFALPDLRGRVPVGFGTGPGLPAVACGESLGEATHTLTTNEMPTHNHLLQGNPTPDSSDKTPANSVWSSFTNLYTGDSGDVNTLMSPTALQNAGGSQPHPNLQPYTVGSYCIAIIGIFPSRN